MSAESDARETKSDDCNDQTDQLVRYLLTAGAIERILCFLHASTSVCDSLVNRDSSRRSRSVHWGRSLSASGAAIWLDCLAMYQSCSPHITDHWTRAARVFLKMSERSVWSGVA